VRGGIYDALSVEGGAATAGHRRSRELDAVRAIAALAVLAGHAYPIAGSGNPPRTSLSLDAVLVNNGGSGIWLFFALSGYLIGAPFLRALRDGTPLPSLAGYATRAGRRIPPGVLGRVSATLLLAAAGPAVAVGGRSCCTAVLAHGLFPGEVQYAVFRGPGR
jgi:peptidoglycan/LPS O-acetylase OafA/YrhL